MKTSYNLEKIQEKINNAVKKQEVDRDNLFVILCKNPEGDLSFSLAGLNKEDYHIYGNIEELNSVKMGRSFKEFYQNLKTSENIEVINILGNTTAKRKVLEQFNELKGERQQASQQDIRKHKNTNKSKPTN